MLCYTVPIWRQFENPNNQMGGGKWKGILPTLSPFLASSNQWPLGDSPQLWVVMKGQALNPSDELSWFLRLSRIDRVPNGEVRYNWIWPRDDVDSVTTASTCSRKLTSEGVPLQPFVSKSSSMKPFMGMVLEQSQTENCKMIEVLIAKLSPSAIL